MEKGPIVRRLLLPAHQDAAKAIQPAMTALHDPPARCLARLARDRLGFLAARPNGGREAKLLKDGAYLIVVIALIQAQARPLVRAVRSGCSQAWLALASYRGGWQPQSPIRSALPAPLSTDCV